MPEKPSNRLQFGLRTVGIGVLTIASFVGACRKDLQWRLEQWTNPKAAALPDGPAGQVFLDHTGTIRGILDEKGAEVVGHPLIGKPLPDTPMREDRMVLPGEEMRSYKVYFGVPSTKN